MIILLLLIIILVFTVYKLSCFIKIKHDKEILVSTIPKFNLLTLGNKSFSNKSIDYNYKTIIINLFSPSCEHCQNSAKLFLKNTSKLKDMQILMISTSDSLSLIKFQNDYHLLDMPNLIILRDTNYQSLKIFGSSVIPSFFIYKNNKLNKKYIGETKINLLID